MKQTLLVIMAAVLASYTNAQQQLQNPGFEDWEEEGTSEAEPVNWSSLKTADALAFTAPEVLSKVTGRTGDWAAMLEVKSIFSILANGIMTNGRVHADFTPANGYVFTDASDPQWSTLFTDRPDSLTGWYKFAPESGDIGKIEIILHTGTAGELPRPGGTTANEIGNVRYNFTTPQTDWTRFSQPFNYYSTDAPEYVLTTITSGDSTISKNGTKLWIDDLELIYNSDLTAGIKEYSSQEMAINGSNGYLYFGVESDEEVFYSIADVTGKVIQSGRAQSKTPFSHESGIYFIQVETRKETFTKKLYIHQ
jgi:hypothetical protein